MIDLKEVLVDYATTKNFKIEELEGGKIGIDVGMRLKDDRSRFQFVWVWLVPGRGNGKDCIYFTSRVGIYTPKVNLYQLIKESGNCVYSTITIIPDKDEAGKPCETIVVQASPIHEYLSKEELISILWEVAEVADILEERHFGGDTN